ncbi:MAG: ribonuclease HII [Alphaproteobacteria bacterium]|jgi:ribonuclease HII|nr:ribonuclease HII [Alphaproteobacteria bacterium]
MKTKPDLFFEDLQEGIIAGLDEAGCGPWAGALVAAAVILPSKLPNYIREVNDSKKLSRAKREFLYDKIVGDSSIDWSAGIVDPVELDTILLRKAIPLAYKRAVDGLIHIPTHLLIDGIRDPKLPYSSTLIKQGDQKSLSIATASIIAKVTRDRLMDQLHEEFPAYGWNQNAGYGTKQHQEALSQFGVTRYHRKSYAPIKVYLNE